LPATLQIAIDDCTPDVIRMQHYFLAKHAFVCALGQDVIVLDLRNDKYVSFEREFWDPIARTIGGWPSDESAGSAADDEPDETALAQLLESGLLTGDAGEGKDASPAMLAPPTISMMEDFRAQRPAIRLSHVCVFLGAILTALVRLRFQSLERIVGGIRRNRQRRDQEADFPRTRDLTEIFRRLRPMLFTSRNHCLFESLALLHFLSHYRIHPTWVFGVQTTPFIAHCWLQQGSCACNDTLDHVHRYTPIMLV
jgi:hypothetical protein